MADALDAKTQQFLTDVVTAAGLLHHGKRDKKLAERIGAAAMSMRMRGMPEHWSDCATSNGPAYPVGPCDCGATPVANLSMVMQPKMLGPGHMTDAERLVAAGKFRGE